MFFVKNFSDLFLIIFTAVVLTNYLIQRTEYMESYVEYRMLLCSTNEQKIEQLEKWDSDPKFDIPPFRSRESWNTFWLMYKGKAYHKYRHLFSDDYILPHLRENKIALTDGGKYIIF
ncbi:hypothetical protein B9Z55_022316 [Caenorhabditis nigoni]|uniref:Uncharacterized protein n=1 Tax=Caenorhabditis nigoni TaxID=1611254 RepID=A0A2G5SK89_9PELO|nr:hypothetical protein B9Z55_022316 [Caenorhabditis nigoni]